MHDLENANGIAALIGMSQRENERAMSELGLQLPPVEGSTTETDDVFPLSTRSEVSMQEKRANAVDPGSDESCFEVAHSSKTVSA